MWFKVAPGDLDFAANASQRFTYEITSSLPPDAVFERITDPAHAPTWVTDCKSSRWLEGQGPGGLRLMTLKGLSVEERVIAWEPGRHFAFAIERATVPILKRMVEDMRLEAVADGTRVRWSIAYEARLLARPLAPILRPRFRTMFARSAAALAGLGAT